MAKMKQYTGGVWRVIPEPGRFWWLAWLLRPLALGRIIVLRCSRIDCDDCVVFGGCPKWGRPHA